MLDTELVITNYVVTIEKKKKKKQRTKQGRRRRKSELSLLDRIGPHRPGVE